MGPLIDTRQLKTDILVHNGETVVLGGIYETKNSVIVSRVPFLSSLPLIGVLFKRKRNVIDKNQLVIFLTPIIVYSEKKSVNLDEIF